MKVRYIAFLIFLSILFSVSLYPDTPSRDSWFIYDAKNQVCIKAEVGDHKISPDMVINTYGCKVVNWSFEDRWIILGCNTRQIQGLLLFTREKQMCEEVREIMIQATSI